MGQFKPMVKMETTEPSVELKLKKGGSVTSAKKMMNGGVMGALSQAPSPGARGGMAPVARPRKPSMMDRRKAMMGKPMMAKGGSMNALKAHADKPASKAHAGLKAGGMMGGGGMHMMPDGSMMKDSAMKKGGKACATGGVVNGQGGYKKGGDVKMAMGGMMDGSYKKGGMPMAMKGGKKVPAFLASKMADGGKACATGGVVNGNAGGFKKGGATKKHYATGGAVNNSGRAVAMPKKPVSQPVSNDRQSGTFKKGGMVKMQGGGQVTDNERKMLEKAMSKKGSGALTDSERQRILDKAYNDSIGPSKEDADMAESIRSIPGRLFRGAKDLIGMGKNSGAGSVTETEKSVTVEPSKKRGGSVKC